jgi:hypothetical protein
MVLPLSSTATSGNDCAAAAAMDGSHPVAANAGLTRFVAGGEPEVLLNRPEGVPAETDRLRARAPVIPHQGPVRHLDRGVRADVGLCERWRIVDAIVDHCDNVPSPLQLLDRADLLLPQQLCPDVQPELPAQRLRHLRAAAYRRVRSGRSHGRLSPRGPRIALRPRAPAARANDLGHASAVAAHEALGAHSTRSPSTDPSTPSPERTSNSDRSLNDEQVPAADVDPVPG